MNIKYMSLLSLFCVVAANAAKLPDMEKFNERKSAWISCDRKQMSQTPWSILKNGFVRCEKEKTEYDAALAELQKEHDIALAKKDLELAQLLDEKINHEITSENRRKTTDILEFTNRTKI